MRGVPREPVRHEVVIHVLGLLPMCPGRTFAKLARPKGFEPLTFAFGGQAIDFPRNAWACFEMPELSIPPMFLDYFIRLCILCDSA